MPLRTGSFKPKVDPLPPERNLAGGNHWVPKPDGSKSLVVTAIGLANVLAGFIPPVESAYLG
jgi:hypothetical protein